MNPGDVVLISIPQFSGGPGKLRPALLLSVLPGAFQTEAVVEPQPSPTLIQPVQLPNSVPSSSIRVAESIAG